MFADFRMKALLDELNKSDSDSADDGCDSFDRFYEDGDFDQLLESVRYFELNIISVHNPLHFAHVRFDYLLVQITSNSNFS